MCYAWSFGLPGLQHASTLPFLNRIQGNYFPLVANVALPFFVAQGFRWIRDGGRRRAPVAMLAWLILMVAALISAAVLVRPVSGSVIDTLDVFVRRSWPSWAWMFVTVTVWMTFAPRANEVDRFAFWTGVVVFGAVAFYPWAGASLRKEAFAACVAALFLVLAIPRLGRPFDIEALPIALATLSLFVVHAVLAFSGPGLPRRHDLLAAGTYPGFLRSELDGTAQRAYGTLGSLFPHAGPAQRIATLNTLVAMLPLQVETFMQGLLDQKQPAVQLLGLVPRPAVGHDGATAAVLQNRSLWNYIGSRFIVAPLDGFVDRILPGSVFEVRGGWPGDGSVPIPLPARGAKTAGSTWSIACGGDDWEAVVVKLSTYGGAAAQGELDLELRGNKEQVLARTRLDAGRVQDNGFVMLFVGRPFCRANDTLQLRIEQRGYGPGGTDAVWVDQGSTKILHYGLIPAPPHTSRTGSPAQFPLSKGVTGWLRCPVGTADEIRMPFTTSPHPAGTITAALRTMDGGLRESEQIPAREGMAGIHIRLPPALCEAETGLVRVEVEYRPAAAGDEIYYFARPEEPLVLDLIDRPDDFVLRFADQALKGAVLENMEAEKGVFVASAIKTVATWQEGLAAFQSSTRKGDVAFVESPSVCADQTQAPEAAGEGQVRVQGRTLNTIDLTVETTRPAMLVWASSYAPGWSADLDGEPVPVNRVNGVFTGACIPAAGSHKVTFRYFPAGLLPGFMISLVTACGAGLLVVRKTAHGDLL